MCILTMKQENDKRIKNNESLTGAWQNGDRSAKLNIRNYNEHCVKFIHSYFYSQPSQSSKTSTLIILDIETSCIFKISNNYNNCNSYNAI